MEPGNHRFSPLVPSLNCVLFASSTGCAGDDILLFFFFFFSNFATAQRMLNLSRCFFRSNPGAHWISVFPQCIFIGCHSSTTRQEFGRYFEQVVAQCLKKYSFDVAVCGGPKDRGIDFRGVWLLKASAVRVIGQCRRYKRRLGPKHVRELEGTLSHEVKGALGIMVSESG